MRRLRVSRKASARLDAGQLWVYRGEMESIDDSACETALLTDERGRLLGSAVVDGASPVPVRLYARKAQELDAAFLRKRLEAALEWRKRVVSGDQSGYRLVFGEADGLPGLIVDRFGPALAIQVGMRNYEPHLQDVVSIVAEGLLREHNIEVVCAVAEQEGQRKLLRGELGTARALYRMNGFEFEADLWDGPKTGAFLDQRENYLAAGDWARRLGLNGRALDLYSSSGGFALHLASAFSQVDAVDSSGPAVARIQANAARNGISNVRAIEADVKQFLRGLTQARRRYECVIADPPAFAKQTRQKAEATRAYQDLNLRALQAVAPGGLFVTCSCSRAISEADLLDIVRDTAQQGRWQLTLLEKRGQALDHRTDLQLPESSYLKCLYFTVGRLE